MQETYFQRAFESASALLVKVALCEGLSGFF